MSEQDSGDQRAHFLCSFERRRDIKAGRRRRFSVFDWGFQWEGDETRSGRWQEITVLYVSTTRHLDNGRHTYTEYLYKLCMADGWVLRLSGTLNATAARDSANAGIWLKPGVTTAITVEQLGRIIKARSASVLLPPAIARFRAGESTSFGKLAVGPAGITSGYDRVAWSEVEDVQTQRGYVSVKKAGKWLSWKHLPVGLIPNYEVFDALVRTVLAERSDVKQD